MLLFSQGLSALKYQSWQVENSSLSCTVSLAFPCPPCCRHDPEYLQTSPHVPWSPVRPPMEDPCPRSCRSQIPYWRSSFSLPISPQESCCPRSFVLGHEEAGRKVPQMTLHPGLFPFRASPMAESVSLQRLPSFITGDVGNSGSPPSP